MSIRLMTEINENVEYLAEGEGAAKRHYIRGVFAEADVDNRNHRRYPFAILEKEVGRFHTDNIDKQGAYGELGHPQGSNINLDRACILIKEMKADKNTFVGKALVTNTPMGKIVEGLIGDGARLGVSTRALGSLKPLAGGINEVQGDLRLLAVDVVADPSAPSAFVNGIMENVEYIFDAAKDTYIEQHLPDIRRSLLGMTKDRREAAQLQIWEGFLDGISKRNRSKNYR